MLACYTWQIHEGARREYATQARKRSIDRQLIRLWQKENLIQAVMEHD
jgi:hypothetical protein